MSCECNKNKPIKEAMIITRDNLRKWAQDAIYHPGDMKTNPFTKNQKYTKPTKPSGLYGKERDAMVKELIPFLAYLYKKHLKNVIVQEGKTPTFVQFIRENIRLENGKLLLKKKG